MSIRSFRNQATLDIYRGTNTKQSRKILPQELHNKVQRRLDRLDKAENLQEIEATPGYNLKKLSGKRKGQVSIRINRQYRIFFTGWMAMRMQ